MRAQYDLRPEKYSANGDGSYTYRWDIEAKTDGSWQCNEVVVWGTVTREKIVAKVIEETWGSIESKLLNDYNAALMEILPDEYITRYADFLTERKARKEQINADCAEIGL